MSFAHPLVLLLLAIPVLLAAWEWQRRGHVLVLPFDHGDLPKGRKLGRLVKSLATAPEPRPTWVRLDAIFPLLSSAATTLICIESDQWRPNSRRPESAT